MAGGATGQATQNYSTAANTAGQIANAGPAQYGQQTAANMNPYIGAVANTTMNDLNRSRQMAVNDVGAAAQSAGAFGGSRHGVAEAETNRGFMDVAANTMAGLYSQGFDNAQNATLNQNNQRLNAASQLGGLSQQAFDNYRTVNQDQYQQGLMQQAMNQQLIDAGKDQFLGYANQPAQSLQYPLAALGAAPVPETATQSQQPGLFNYLSLGLGLL